MCAMMQKLRVNSIAMGAALCERAHPRSIGSPRPSRDFNVRLFRHAGVLDDGVSVSHSVSNGSGTRMGHRTGEIFQSGARLVGQDCRRIVAFFQIFYALNYKQAPPVISWCLLGVCFTVAGFLAWRGEIKRGARNYQRMQSRNRGACGKTGKQNEDYADGGMW